jgi:hypothetical protein
MIAFLLALSPRSSFCAVIEESLRQPRRHGGKCGRPQSRAYEAGKIENRAAALVRNGVDSRAAREQVAKEFNITSDYVRRQVDWWLCHADDWEPDPDVEYELWREYQDQMEHGALLRKAAD